MKPLILPVLITTTLAACGGGSSDSNTSAPNTSGSSTALAHYIQGSIDAINGQTLTVNGVEIPVAAHAEISLNDMDASLAQLKVGMPVDIETNGKHAVEIEYDAQLRGEISAIDGELLTVAGFKVQLPQSRSTWQIGDLVEISGIFNGEIWLAQYIELDHDAQQGEVELEGTITALDESAETFQLASMTVYYGNASNDSDQRTPLQNGAWVEVEGRFDMATNTLTAYEYEVDSRDNEADEQEFDIEGAILSINNARTRLVLSPNWTVEIGTNVRYEDGSQADLTVGKIIEVEGQLSNGVIIAQEIEFEQQGNAPALSRNQFEIAGLAQYDGQTLTINGIEVTLSAHTQWDGITESRLVDDMWISVEGRQVNQQLLIDEIEWEREHGYQPELEHGYYEISLEGPVNQGEIWGYSASDASLNNHNGKWLELECRINWPQTQISHCQLDD